MMNVVYNRISLIATSLMGGGKSLVLSNLQSNIGFQIRFFDLLLAMSSIKTRVWDFIFMPINRKLPYYYNIMYKSISCA